MNTKEAIEIVCIGREKLLTVSECHKVVDCLKRGEKVEAMWEEFCLNEGDLVKVVTCIKRRYEQKYFPKSIKREEVIKWK